MEVSQQTFSMFYAISYGVMPGNLSSLKAFPWSWPAGTDAASRRQLIFRLMFSVLFLNIIPFFIFAVGYRLFGAIKGGINSLFAVLSGMASLSVFASYRIHHAVVSIRHMWLYTDVEWNLTAGESVFRKSLPGHGIAVVCYLLPLFLVWLITVCTL